jgi:hypothetical protein
MLNHTPGPWNVHIHTENDACLNVIAGEATYAGSTTRADWIAELDNTADKPFEEVQANALLLAASPDLLEACERAIRFIQNGIEFGYITLPDPDTDDPAHDTLPKLVAAVARAKGLPK